MISGVYEPTEGRVFLDGQAIMGLCDRILDLSFGERIAEGTPTEITNDPKVIQAYLGEQKT